MCSANICIHLSENKQNNAIFMFKIISFIMFTNCIPFLTAKKCAWPLIIVNQRQ